MTSDRIAKQLVYSIILLVIITTVVVLSALTPIINWPVSFAIYIFALGGTVLAATGVVTNIERLYHILRYERETLPDILQNGT